MANPVCKHCKANEADAYRGLCAECHGRPNVRKRYPALYRSSSSGGREMSEAEVEALVEEQGRNLPHWWPEDEARMRELDAAGQIPTRHGF